jgi:hypothetical protein
MRAAHNHHSSSTRFSPGGISPTHIFDLSYRPRCATLSTKNLTPVRDAERYQPKMQCVGCSYGRTNWRSQRTRECSRSRSLVCSSSTTNARELQSPALLATLRGMKQQPRLVSGTCPSCQSNEIIIKTTDDVGTDFAGYCPRCGADISGALLDGVARAIVAQ